MKHSHVYIVSCTDTQAVFSSLAAIYDYYTEAQMGIKLQTLWGNKQLKSTGYFTNNKVTIEKALVYRKKRKE